MITHFSITCIFSDGFLPHFPILFIFPIRQQIQGGDAFFYVSKVAIPNISSKWESLPYLSLLRPIVSFPSVCCHFPDYSTPPTRCSSERYSDDSAEPTAEFHSTPAIVLTFRKRKNSKSKFYLLGDVHHSLELNLLHGVISTVQFCADLKIKIKLQKFHGVFPGFKRVVKVLFPNQKQLPCKRFRIRHGRSLQSPRNLLRIDSSPAEYLICSKCNWKMIIRRRPITFRTTANCRKRDSAYVRKTERRHALFCLSKLCTISSSTVSRGSKTLQRLIRRNYLYSIDGDCEVPRMTLDRSWVKDSPEKINSPTFLMKEKRLLKFLYKTYF